MTPNEEQALRLELEKLRAENELMKQLSTQSGFFEYYFKICGKKKFRVDAFEEVNQLYKELFGEEKFPSHESFKMSINRFYKQNKSK